MPEGPFGFRRLTGLGPLVSSRDSHRTFTEREDVDFSKRQWFRREPDDLSEECRPYTNLENGVEFIIPTSHAKPIGVIDSPATDREIFRAVSEAEQRSDGFIGVHQTSTDKSRMIMDNGFDPNKVGDMSVATDISLRENAVFTWHFIWDVKMQDETSAVIVAAPRDKVTVSNMSASVTVPKETYVRDFTMMYPQYITCLRKHGPNSPTTFEEDIIQDLRDYRPGGHNA